MSTLFDTGPEMKITAIAPWFGGKRTLAPAIVREIGKHSVYWEPFCGSMAVLFAKPPVQSETVNDLNGDVTNLARVIASSEGPALFERLARTMFAEAMVTDAKAMRRTEGLSPLDAAYWFFVGSWMGRNGGAGTRESNTAFCVRYTSNGGDPAVRFRSAVASIPAWADRLMGVTVLQRDAMEVIGRIEDKPGTVIYVDPPYFAKGAKYVHDFDDQQFLAFADGRVIPIHYCYELEPGQPRAVQIDAHAYLAKLLNRFQKTRVVLSYYDDQRIADLYPASKWTVSRLRATKAIVNQGMRDKSGTTDAPEVLIINGESYA